MNAGYTFRRMMAPLEHRVRLMLGRAILTAIDDSTLVQALQIEALDGERHDGVEHFQTYGLTSVPPAGLEALIAFVGGLRSHGVAIAVGDRKYRMRGLSSGEVAIYDDQGQHVLLGRDAIVVKTDRDVRIEGQSVTVLADRVDLGGAGGAKVARVGDPVEGGVIVDGSDVVFAV